MNAQENKVPQPGLPRGFVGWIVAWIMLLAHSPIYKRLSRVLNLQPEDYVGGVDKLRIKFWDIATGEVIYDNKMGEDDNSNAGAEIGGSSIVIHKDE